MPAIAKQIYHVESGGYGILLSASGLGALTAAIFVSSFSEKLSVRKTIGIVLSICALAILAFSYVASFWLGFLLLYLIGFCLLTQISLINATIQRTSPDYIRGRVMSVYSLMFLGVLPLGGLTIGTLASLIGIPEAIRLFALITLCGAALYLFFLQHRLKEI